MKDDWMEKTKPGKRKSEYSSPEREPVRQQKGNIGEVIREKNQRTKKQSGG